jgi:hypothetical protein
VRRAARTERASVRAGCQVTEKRGWSALAAVTFVNGRPTASITIFLDEIVRLVEHGRLAGTAAWQWPRSMRERVIGRAVGRVIAPEIGHIVLESRLSYDPRLPTRRILVNEPRGR